MKEYPYNFLKIFFMYQKLFNIFSHSCKCSFKKFKKKELGFPSNPQPHIFREYLQRQLGLICIGNFISLS